MALRSVSFNSARERAGGEILGARTIEGRGGRTGKGYFHGGRCYTPVNTEGFSPWQEQAW